MNKLTTSEIEKNYEEMKVLFTARQIELIRKKLAEKELTPTEKVFYSRSINKRLKAIEIISHKEKYFIYGEKDIIPERKKKAISLLKKIERRHKGMKILITGRFLWGEKYNDIDIFIISKYEKEDFFEKQLHHNYLLPEETNTLFFTSLSKLCISNFPIDAESEEVQLETILSNYQELLADINNNIKEIKSSLRKFLLNAIYISEKIVLSSKELDNLVGKILKHHNKAYAIRKLFVSTLLTSYPDFSYKNKLEELKQGYTKLEKTYGKDKFYEELIKSYEEVLAVEI